MAINLSKRERNRWAASELAQKLKLEDIMKPDLNRMLKRMANDLQASINSTGEAPSGGSYTKNLTGILSSQYDRTQARFSNRVTNALGELENDSPVWMILLAIGAQQGLKNKKEVLNFIKSETRVQTNKFIESNVEKDSANITRTNDRALQAALATSSAILAQELDRAPTRTELALAAKKQFISTNIKRSDTIAATVTQKAAEGMKSINKDVFLGYRNNMTSMVLQIPNNEGGEVWVSMGDSVARPEHLEADGQAKLNGAFSVWGESLKYPGDDSLGASLKNIINCRCSSVFTYEENFEIPASALEPEL